MMYIHRERERDRKKVFSTQWNNGYAIVLRIEPEICPCFFFSLWYDDESTLGLSECHCCLSTLHIRFCFFVNLFSSNLSNQSTVSMNVRAYDFMRCTYRLNCTSSDCDNGRIMYISWQYCTTWNCFRKTVYCLNSYTWAISNEFDMMTFHYQWHSRISRSVNIDECTFLTSHTFQTVVLPFPISDAPTISMHCTHPLI